MLLWVFKGYLLIHFQITRELKDCWIPNNLGHVQRLTVKYSKTLASSHLNRFAREVPLHPWMYAYLSESPFVGENDLL